MIVMKLCLHSYNMTLIITWSPLLICLIWFDWKRKKLLLLCLIVNCCIPLWINQQFLSAEPILHCCCYCCHCFSPRLSMLTWHPGWTLRPQNSLQTQYSMWGLWKAPLFCSLFIEVIGVLAGFNAIQDCGFGFDIVRQLFFNDQCAWS